MKLNALQSEILQQADAMQLACQVDYIDEGHFRDNRDPLPYVRSKTGNDVSILRGEPKSAPPSFCHNFIKYLLPIVKIHLSWSFAIKRSHHILHPLLY